MDKPIKSEDDLRGFNIRINEFGEMERNMNIDDINDFLDENIRDKKMIESKNEEE